jgi:hypothetical protein
LRLLAWWQGYDAEYFASKLASDKSAADRLAERRSFQSVFDPAEKQADEWTEVRTKLVQDIWTRGCIVPGGDAYAADLMAGSRLNAAETMLEIGIGFGGSTPAIIERYQNYVTCHERNPALASAVRRQAIEHRVADKLEIIQSNLEKVKFKSGYFRAALLREVLYTIEGKDVLLEKVRNALKSGESQIVITDLMFDGETAAPGSRPWAKVEPVRVYPYSLDELTTALTRLGFTIRTAEDDSGVYRRMIIDAWKSYLTTLDTESLPPDLGRQIVHEANFWAARIGALDAGALRYVRVVGVRNS